MEYRKLGKTDIDVSVICLGTMTWGEQNTEAEAHKQLDYALENGVNFIDVAEMYPVPARAETSGRTEEYIGTWIASRKNRDKFILATKVVGPCGMDWIRPEPRLDRNNIMQAVEGSLKRLQTDYIDLYQLHWPDRRANFFGERGFDYNPDEKFTPPEETLEVLDELVKSGKVRHVGLSNETPWGAMEFLRIAEEKGWPRMASIQNPYSLLNRLYEIGLSEVSIREECGLLAYSPLACGVLSGKYLNDSWPEGARMSLWRDYFTRYQSKETYQATEAYVNLAKKHGLDPSQMALAYVNTRDFVTSNIIGATSMEQLKTNINSINVTLSDEVLSGIEAIHESQPNPAP